MRSKLFSLLLIVLAVFVLAGCTSGAEQEITKALDQIAVPSGLVDDFELPTKQGDVELEWVSNSNNLKVEKPEGGKVKITVNRNAEDVVVKLTVKASLKKKMLEKDFNVLIYGTNRPEVEINEDSFKDIVRGLTLVVPTRAHSNLNLKPVLPVGVDVTWTSSNEELVKADGTVTRPNGKGQGVKLVATVVANNGEEDFQEVLDLYVFVYGKEINVSGAYNQAFSEIVTLNPINATGVADSDVYELLTDSLYHADYNWDKAIADGNAAFPGDFSKVRDRKAVVDPEDGKIEMPALGYIRTLGMAAAFPYGVTLENDFDLGHGKIDEKASKENQDNEWIIKIRQDLKFADGRKIDAKVFEYSYQQYLDGKQNNERANYLYNKDYLPLVNGEEYFKQGRDIDPNDPSKGKYPKVEWSEVGFKVIDDYTFKIELTGPVSQWSLMGTLGIINLVHPEKFEAGKNVDKTRTTYGSITNIPVSYGPYVLSSWEDDVKFTFTRNENYYKNYEYTIKTINGPIIKDQTARVNEFKAGKLDVAGVGGEFWKEFMDNPNLYVSPSNSFYRFAISLDRSGGTSGKTSSPILSYPEFRKALYLATDREDYTNEVQAPSEPALGFLSNVHQVTEWATGAYAKSAVALEQLEELGLSPATGGYNLTSARALFKTAYEKAVADGKYTAGQKVEMEFVFYDAGSNIKMANWAKANYEQAFNKQIKHNGVDIEFEVKLVPLNSASFTAARNAGDFDLAFTGMSGATFQATFGMGYIFSRSFSTFLVGRGHNTGELPVRAEIVYLTSILKAKPEADLEDFEKDFLEAVDENGVFEGTFDELFLLFSETRSLEVEYEGQQEDLTNITAALERALLEQGIAIPLFSATSAAVYSDKVIRMAPAFSLFMSWGGLTYTHIKA